MSENKFSPGDLVVPNEDLLAAFTYDEHNTELLENVEYRVATSAEFIWFRKNRGFTPVEGGIETYKRSMQKTVGDVYKSIDNEKNNQKKHGLS